MGDTLKLKHETWMRVAYEQALHARDVGEVPVGAAVIADGQVIGVGFNQTISAVDPTAHAEVVALRDASRRLGNYRLTGTALYVTVEPCLMCAGALVHARVGTLVYGTSEPKTGAVRSVARVLDHWALNHQIEVVQGVLVDECRELIQSFFESRRKRAGFTVS